MQKTITLTVNSQELTFDVDMAKYNKYTNELLPHNKVAPAENFLRRCVIKDHKAALDELLKLPSAAVQLTAALIDDYMPDLEIEVGK